MSCQPSLYVMLVQLLAFIGWIAIGSVGTSILARERLDGMVGKVFESNAAAGMLMMLTSIMAWPVMVPSLFLLERYGRKLTWWS